MNKIKHLITKYKKSFKPSWNLDFTYLLGFYLIIQTAFVAVVCYKHEFDVTDSTVFVYFFEKYILDFAALAVGVTVLLRIFRNIIAGYIYTIFYFLLTATNTMVYYNSSTLLEKYYFELITFYSIAGFITLHATLFLLAFLTVLFFVRLPLQKLVYKVKWVDVVMWGLICLTLSFVDSAELFSKRKTQDDRLDKVIMVFRNGQLEYASQNPLAAFTNNIILKSISDNLYKAKGSKKYLTFLKQHNLFSENFNVTSDTKELQTIIDKYKLPIGKRNYPNLKLGEFKRVIYIFLESLSQDLMSCHNPKLKFKTTPYLCSDKVRATSFKGVRTSASPTLQALTTLFSSHPNYNIQKPTGDKNTFQKVLKKAGYKNLFIRSASKFYANENIVFKKWGYDSIEAREDFFKRPELRKYIYGWGLEDRILYDEAIERLKKHKDEKVFVTLLGTDTHPLHGQVHFKHLKYPRLGPGFKKEFTAAGRFMKAVHYVDFDIKRFVQKLDEAGLYTKDTLIVLSADHSCPPNAVTRRIPGHTKRSLGNMPLVLLSPQKLPSINPNHKPSSQVDIAPTLLHLMNLPIPKGYWGESLFLKNKNNPIVGYNKQMVIIEDNGKKMLFNMKNKRTDADKEFHKLFSTVIID